MIKFKTLKWKNLLSTGNAFTELRLDKNQRTLIHGTNGSGKSTILDALSFALYNKPFRKVNKGQLVNTINNKDCLVEVTFETGGSEYLVRRGIKPNLFEIYKDDVLLNQEAASKDYQNLLERNILKMNHQAFCQIVVLGSASYTPFMQLPAERRRSVVEDLLDLQIFTTMNNILKERITKNKESQIETRGDVARLQGMIEVQKRLIQSKSESIDDRCDENEAKIVKLRERIVKFNEAEQVAAERIAAIDVQISELVEQPELANKFRNLMENLGSTLKLKRKDVTFFVENHHCPVCRQEIAEEFRQQQIQDLNDEIVELCAKEPAAYNSFVDAKNKTQTLTALQSERHNIENKLAALLASLKQMQQQVDDLAKENERLRNTGQDQAGLIAARQDLDNLVEDFHEHEAALEETIKIGVKLGYASVLLKDSGIKGQSIKQYIPLMNKLINKYLSDMNFFVQFELNEQFDEVIRSRFRDEFSYSSFSEGEKFRLNVAILFAWRDLAKIRNSASTNLLIMDEVFDSSLDAGGLDDFMKIINAMSKDVNLFVISHRGDVIADKFEHQIKFEKQGNFSRIVE